MYLVFNINQSVDREIYTGSKLVFSANTLQKFERKCKIWYAAHMQETLYSLNTLLKECSKRLANKNKGPHLALQI